MNDSQEANEVTTVADDVRAAVTAAKEAPVETPVEKADRSRDEQGKFAKGEQKAEVKTEAKTEAKADVKADPVVETVEEKVEEKKPTKVPRGLKAHMQAKWGELPPEWQAEVERIDRAGAEGYAKVSEKVKYAEAIENEIRPYEALIRAEGGTHAGAVRDLLRTAALLRTGTPQQKLTALLQTAQQFNIPLTQQAGTSDPLAQHPLVQQLTQKLHYLENSLNQRSEQENTARQVQAETAIDSFLNESDTNGVPKYPLDDSLQDEFAAEIGFLRQRHQDMDHRQVLEKAYERLSWKVPEIRQELMRRQDAEKEAQRRKVEQEAIDKKKAASGSLKGSSAPMAKPQEGSVRDLVAAAVRSGNRI